MTLLSMDYLAKQGHSAPSLWSYFFHEDVYSSVPMAVKKLMGLVAGVRGGGESGQVRIRPMCSLFGDLKGHRVCIERDCRCTKAFVSIARR